MRQLFEDLMCALHSQRPIEARCVSVGDSSPLGKLMGEKECISITMDVEHDLWDQVEFLLKEDDTWYVRVRKDKDKIGGWYAPTDVDKQSKTEVFVKSSAGVFNKATDEAAIELARRHAKETGETATVYLALPWRKFEVEVVQKRA